MGVIGYIPEDGQLLSIASRVLKPNGQFFVSCRNRLFNMVSFSERTKEEIRTNNALKLLDEIEELYQSIPADQSRAFLCAINKVSGSILQDWNITQGVNQPPSQLIKDSEIIPIEPRQHTPREIEAVASDFGFTVDSFVGIHPHLLDPRINRLLPPGVYNNLCSAAETLETSPISLIWSSVFIATLKRM